MRAVLPAARMLAVSELGQSSLAEAYWRCGCCLIRDPDGLWPGWPAAQTPASPGVPWVKRQRPPTQFISSFSLCPSIVLMQRVHSQVKHSQWAATLIPSFVHSPQTLTAPALPSLWLGPEIGRTNGCSWGTLCMGDMAIGWVFGG